MFLSEEA